MPIINSGTITLDTVVDNELIPVSHRPFTRPPRPERATKSGHLIYRKYPRAGLRARVGADGYLWWKPAIWLTPTVLHLSPGLHEWTTDQQKAFRAAQATIAACRHTCTDPSGKPLQYLRLTAY